jgi:hypothetical protein
MEVVGRAWICQLYDLECFLGSSPLKWPVGVVFIATNQFVAIGERLLSMGTPVSPVFTHCSRFCRRPLRWIAVAPLVHRTVRWNTGQSGEL